MERYAGYPMLKLNKCDDCDRMATMRDVSARAVTPLGVAYEVLRTAKSASACVRARGGRAVPPAIAGDRPDMRRAGVGLAPHGAPSVAPESTRGVLVGGRVGANRSGACNGFPGGEAGDYRREIVDAAESLVHPARRLNTLRDA